MASFSPKMVSFIKSPEFLCYLFLPCLLSTAKQLSNSGKWKLEAEIPIQDITWDSVTEDVEDEEKAGFLNFVKGMLQWRPEDRKTAAELLNDPWLHT